MKRETALQIATKFYTKKNGVQPESLQVKSMEPANGKIMLRANGYDDRIFEIEIDPISETIVMKQIICADDLADYDQ